MFFYFPQPSKNKIFALFTTLLDYITFISYDDLKEDSGVHKNDSIVVVPGPIEVYNPTEKGEQILLKPKLLPGSPFYNKKIRKEKELVESTTSKEDLLQIYIDQSRLRLSEMNELKSKEDHIQLNATSENIRILVENIKNTFNELIKQNKNINHLAVRAKGLLYDVYKNKKDGEDIHYSNFPYNCLGSDIFNFTENGNGRTD